MIKDKKIIFFDGDGTLWYPKKTKRKVAPQWIYKITGHKDAHLKELILTPGTLQLLRKIKKNKIITVILSTHPEAGNLADAFLKRNVKYLGIYEYFDEFCQSLIKLNRLLIKVKEGYLIKLAVNF